MKKQIVKLQKKLITFLITDLHRHEENGTVIDGVIKQLIQYCKEYGITHIFNAGDNFHSRKGQNQNVLVGFEKNLDDLEEAGIIMHCIPGNHDKADYSLDDSFLNQYKHFPSINLIKNGAGVLLNDIMFHMVPFFDEKGLYVEKLNSYIESIPEVLKKYEGKNILITHVGVSGAKTNAGHTHESQIIKKELFEKFDQVLVGHFHNKTDLDERIHYVGSTIQHNFGEDSYKGIIAIYDDLSFEIWDVNFPKYKVVEYTADDIKNKKLIANLVHDVEQGNNVRIMLIGNIEEIKAIDITNIKLLGIDVRLKNHSIVDGEEANFEMVEYDNNKILDEFKNFCEKESISFEKGIEFLKEINIQ